MREVTRNFLADLGFSQGDLIADQSGRIVSEFLEEIDDAGFLVHGVEDIGTFGEGDELDAGREGESASGRAELGTAAEN